jgi:hypothetical protein
VSFFSAEAFLVKTAQILVVVALLTSLSSGRASGQNPPESADDSDVRIVSSFVAPGEPVLDECREEAHTFTRSLVRYPRPASWHWVLVCDEAGWRRFLRLSRREEQAAIYASTNLAGRTTYIRGDKLLYPFDLRAEPNAIIAHELAHIQLNSRSESRADCLARRWRDASKDGAR